MLNSYTLYFRSCLSNVREETIIRMARKYNCYFTHHIHVYAQDRSLLRLSRLLKSVLANAKSTVHKFPAFQIYSLFDHMNTIQLFTTYQTMKFNSNKFLRTIPVHLQYFHKHNHVLSLLLPADNGFPNQLKQYMTEKG